MDIFIKSTSAETLLADLIAAGINATDEHGEAHLPNDWTRFDDGQRSDFHYCGALCQTPGVYDEDGNEVTAPVMYEGVHLNVRCGSTVAQIIADAGFDTVEPETPNVVFG